METPAAPHDPAEQGRQASERISGWRLLWWLGIVRIRRHLPGLRSPFFFRSPCSPLRVEERVEQVNIDQNCGHHDGIGPRASHQAQIDQHPREAETDDPCVEAHAYATE